MYIYHKAEKNNWVGRSSDNQEYLYQIVKIEDIDNLVEASLHQKNFAILGYCVDEGVKRNQGRVGAALAPDTIRNFLGRLAIHQTINFIDAGNIYIKEQQLENVQDALATNVSALLAKNYLPIVLGGGHDIAYGHFKGIYQQYPDKKIGIVNFDAHFDLRSMVDQPNSGTPFLQVHQLLEEDKKSLQYLCLGIRTEANTQALFNTADALSVQYILRENFNLHQWDSIHKSVLDFIDEMDMIYITVDMDGFSSAYAPGVSAPSPMGFDVDIFFKTFKLLLNSNKVVSIDIAELNPEYDNDHCTARLAASIIWQVLHHQ